MDKTFWTYVVEGSSAHHATVWSELGNFIWLGHWFTYRQQALNFVFLFRKRPDLFKTCTTCSELPSYTMNHECALGLAWSQLLLMELFMMVHFNVEREDDLCFDYKSILEISDLFFFRSLCLSLSPFCFNHFPLSGMFYNLYLKKNNSCTFKSNLHLTFFKLFFSFFRPFLKNFHLV